MVPAPVLVVLLLVMLTYRLLVVHSHVALVSAVFGGPGYYPYGSPTSGWSIELVIKLGATEAASKLFELGSGAAASTNSF